MKLGPYILLLASVFLLGCQSDLDWNYSLEYRLAGTGMRTQVWIALPQGIPGRQEILTREYSLRPLRYEVRDGDSAALFQLTGARSLAILRISGKVRLHSPTSTPFDTMLTNRLEKWSAEQLHYRNHPEEDNWIQALARGSGDCSEFADLAVETCRRAGYEAHRIEGIAGPDSGKLAHAWAECTRSENWMRLDPVRRQTEPARQDRDGYLQIKNLGHWPEFSGKRAVAALSAGATVRAELHARLVPAD